MLYKVSTTYVLRFSPFIPCQFLSASDKEGNTKYLYHLFIVGIRVLYSGTGLYYTIFLMSRYVSEPCTCSFSVIIPRHCKSTPFSPDQGFVFWLKSIVNGFLFVETCDEHSVSHSVQEFVLPFLRWFPVNNFVLIGDILMFWPYFLII
jgi:hypothetical protein